jgi:2-oxoglutarate ferredoxin oxidoreductase subunit alpha
VKNNFVLSGTESIGLGAIDGGCNFISSYPMSPSTGVLVFLSQQSNAFDIIAEQAEDEISAINMALGAWYAGARGMVTTSGGGFALMAEGLSLAGVTESPIVIHLAQRPGPGTGLPTRTEQADLLFALRAGHGEFPRIILAPGSPEHGFSLAQKAFNLADKYQVPVFLLTDQYFLDSNFSFSSLDLSAIKVEKKFIRTTPSYKRYQLTTNGLSPRGIPGYGEGLVTLDSDEHEEDGRITENSDVRIQMVKKRLKKLELLKQDIIPPELIGPAKYKYLVICWGSTYHAVREALNTLKRDDLAALHFKQVYPVHPITADYLKKADKTIILEGNATAQFKQVIKLQTSIEIDDQILKYNGQPFSVEEIIKQLKERLS